MIDLLHVVQHVGISLICVLLQLASSNSVIAEHVEVDGESRYRIHDIIGKNDAIGVNCLRWSGTIAGETSQAYDDVSK